MCNEDDIREQTTKNPLVFATIQNIRNFDDSWFCYNGFDSSRIN
jgi:hypothetical protein